MTLIFYALLPYVLSFLYVLYWFWHQFKSLKVKTITKLSEENKVLGQINTVFPPLPYSENTVSLNQTDMQVMEQRVSQFQYIFTLNFRTSTVRSLCFSQFWTVTHVNPLNQILQLIFSSLRVMRLLPSRVNPLFGFFFFCGIPNTWRIHEAKSERKNCFLQNRFRLTWITVYDGKKNRYSPGGMACQPKIYLHRIYIKFLKSVFS